MLIKSQACEQLNAWLAGFQPVVNRMNDVNFNWFMHVMFFIHTKEVMERIKKKENMDVANPFDEEGDEDPLQPETRDD